MIRIFALATLLAATNALAQKSDDRVLIYIDDVVAADKALAADATALTTALCAAIAKEKRVDVLCAPDVKQILQFAATAAMVGTQGGGPAGAVQERLDRTKHVVSASFKKDGGNYVLVVKGGPKAADATAMTLYSDKPTIALEERADAQRKILEKLPALAARINAALVPANGAALPPPAPVTPASTAKPAKTTGGW